MYSHNYATTIARQVSFGLTPRLARNIGARRIRAALRKLRNCQYIGWTKLDDGHIISLPSGERVKV